MTILYVNTGTSPNQGDGDSLRVSFNKINQNFREIVNTLNTSTTGTAVITVTGIPPTNPREGALWFDTISGKLYIWYDSFWVDPNPDALAGPAGPRGLQGIEGIQGLDGPSGPQGPISTTLGPSGPAGPAGNTSGPTGPQGPSGPYGIGYKLTSDTTHDFTVGVKVFTTNLNANQTAFTIGDLVLLHTNINNRYIAGRIVDFQGNQLTLNSAIHASGLIPSGTESNWTFGLVGQIGATGPSGPQGTPGTNGLEGIQGLNGPSGPSGPQGAGASGPRGPSGPTGPAFAGGDLTNTVSITLLNQSNSTTTGALTVVGGVGIGRNLTVGQRLSFTQTQEPMQTLNGATGQVTHDCSRGVIFNHIGLTSNFTVNLTNLNLDVGYATNISLILNQGSTPYIPTALKIDGTPRTIYWQGNSIAPGGSPGKKEVVSFSIYYDASAGYIVLGQLVSFG
jgi:hypothetical protein